MAELLMHYAIPSARLPELATIGIAKVAIFAFRCSSCSEDFHIDFRPNFCPACGESLTTEKSWGGESTT